jgi:hypothetical protein
MMPFTSDVKDEPEQPEPQTGKQKAIAAVTQLFSIAEKVPSVASRCCSSGSCRLGPPPTVPVGRGAARLPRWRKGRGRRLEWIVEDHLDRAEADLIRLQADYEEVMQTSNKARFWKYEKQHIAHLEDALEQAHRCLRAERR